MSKLLLVSIFPGEPEVPHFKWWHMRVSMNGIVLESQFLPRRQTCRPPSLISAGWERLLLLASVESFITLDLFNTAQPLTRNSR